MPDLRYILIKREVGPSRKIEVLKANLEQALAAPESAVNPLLQARDQIQVFAMTEQRQDKLEELNQQLRSQASFAEPERLVQVNGNVKYPGIYPLTEQMRISDLMTAAVDFLPETDMAFALLIREQGVERTLRVRQVDLSTIVADVDSAENLALQSRDELMVFSTSDQRQEQLAEVVAKLGQQSEFDKPQQVVRIGGRVRFAGSYPLFQGMSVSDLLKAGGGLQESAYALQAELTRYSVINGEFRQVDHLHIDLAALLAGDPQADVRLQAHDYVTIQELPKWRDRSSVSLRGEVRFPGDYQIREGETLAEVIERAGGFTEQAYLAGAIFTRQSLKEKEQQTLERLSASLEFDLLALSVERAGDDKSAAQSMPVLKGMLENLKQARSTGRLVIDLPTILAHRGDAIRDIVLENQDQLFIPGRQQEVTVVGEVFHPTSHVYLKGYDVDDYIDSSGGMTARADAQRIYIVRVNGSVETFKKTWFSTRSVRPGDTVVVPLDVETFSKLKLWTNISQIVYQLGIAAASWKTVGLF